MTPRTLKQSDNGNFSCYRWIQIRCCIKFAYRKVASAIMNARICIRLFRQNFDVNTVRPPTTTIRGP